MPVSDGQPVNAATFNAVFVDKAGTNDIILNEVASHSTPASGKVALYAKADGKVYSKDDAGTETDLTTGGGGSSLTVETRTISGPEASAKQLTLGATPASAGSTILQIAGAPAQFYGYDFTVSGSVLSWSGLALDGILDSGDKVTIIYT